MPRLPRLLRTLLSAAALLGRASAAEDSAYPTTTPAGTDASATNAVTVRWKKPRDGRPVAEVRGLDPARLAELSTPGAPAADWRPILSVHTGPRGAVRRDLPQLAGDYSVTNGILRFRMAFPVRLGVEYRAEFHPAIFLGRGPDTVAYDRLFLLPPTSSREVPATAVSEVHPAAAELPENLLKFYVQFSAPMSRGEAYRHVRLLDAAGKAVELPFLEIDEELWNADQTRLTLLLDPGRIKRGVRPNDEVGPALVAGGTYSLVVDKDWPDAEGRPLRNAFHRRFRVGPADRTPPDLSRWKLQPPVAGARSALEVDFGEPLDHALAERRISVRDPEGRPVDGTATLSVSDRRWSFVPASPWKPGRLRLVVDETLEDLAGNRIGRPFDLDLAQAPTVPAGEAMRTLEFEVR